VRLDDPAQVRAFVVDYVLPGVTESVTAVRGESA